MLQELSWLSVSSIVESLMSVTQFKRFWLINLKLARRKVSKSVRSWV